jgi:SAM-dependent methyltransferase
MGRIKKLTENSLMHKLDELHYYECKAKILEKTSRGIDVGWMLIEDLIIFRFMRRMFDYESLVLEIGVGSQPRSKVGLCLDDDSFVGCDISISHLKYSKRYYGGNYIACDAENLPFRNASFGAVLSLGVLHHLPSWERGLIELVRVLKKGGLIGLREPIYSRNLSLLRKFSKQESPHEKPIKENLLMRQIALLGLEVIRSCRVFPRIRMPATQIIFRLFPSLRFSKSFWSVLWAFDRICDDLLGRFYICRGSAFLILGKKV